MRRGDDGQIVKVPGPEEWGVDDRSWWPWYGLTRDKVTIIATGLTCQETAADLQRIAEVFEVREAIDWQVMDRGKPPPGYEIRNTSYEDGDDEVGGYGVMIEEWSWYDGGGYTDCAATEAACVASAWEFFEEENAPPGLNPYSGPQAWSWYWGRVAEGGDLAERLHAAGWRPGMTAEGAARMLSEAGR